MLRICRWGRHFSQATTSLSNLHDIRVHNGESLSSPGSYKNPVKSKMPRGLIDQDDISSYINRMVTDQREQRQIIY